MKFVSGSKEASPWAAVSRPAQRLPVNTAQIQFLTLPRSSRCGRDRQGRLQLEAQPSMAAG
jgi:hypothetical protein